MNAIYAFDPNAKIYGYSRIPESDTRNFKISTTVLKNFTFYEGHFPNDIDSCPFIDNIQFDHIHFDATSGSYLGDPDDDYRSSLGHIKKIVDAFHSLKSRFNYDFTFTFRVCGLCD